MPEPVIDKSWLNKTVNKTARKTLALPGNGVIRFIGLHETENPAYRDPTAVLNYGLVSGPVVGRRGAANWYVAYDGTIYHYVLEEQYVAWHAGASAFKDVSGVDQIIGVARLSVVSIGIEVDLPGDGTPPSPVQWDSLCWLVGHLVPYWRLKVDIDHLWAHKIVALPPGRKHDPEGYTLTALLTAVTKK